MVVQERLTTDFEEYAGEILPGIVAAARVEAELYRAKNYAAEYALTANSEYAAKARNSLQELTKYAAVHRVYYASHSDPEFLETVDAIVESFASFTMEYMLLVDKGASAEELGIIKAKMDNEISAFASLIHPHTEQEIANAKLRGEILKQENINARTLIPGTIVLGLVIGTVLSLAVLRSISTPVKRLIEHVQIISTGKLDIEIAPILRESKDEIGDLARAFDQMTKDLREITVSRDKLEREITERAQAEKALRVSEDRLKLALEVSNSGIWDFNPHTFTGAHFNDVWFTMLGYESDELPHTAETWMKLLHPEDIEETQKKLQHHIEGMSEYSCDFRMKAKSNDYRWIHTVGKIISWDNDGHPQRMIGINTDITEQRKIELALKANEARFRSLFEDSPIAPA